MLKMKPTDIAVGVVKFTPELARKVLDEANNNNRKLRKKLVEQYAAIMRRGGWRCDNGDAVSFTKNGQLHNGQHRLAAVEAAGVAVDMLVLDGVNGKTFDTVDTGGNRRVRDILSIIGCKYSSVLDGVMRMLFREEAGDLLSPIKLSNDQVDALLERHPDVVASAEFVVSLNGQNHIPKYFPVTKAIYLHYAYSRVNRELADEFFYKFYTGDDLKKTHPIARLRHKLIQDIADGLLSANDKMALAIKCWNAVLSGKKAVSGLAYKGSGAEAFPRICGLEY